MGSEEHESVEVRLGRKVLEYTMQYREGFRNHVPYKEFQDLQAELISESHRIANNATPLHPGKGWKQNETRNERYLNMLANMQAQPKPEAKPKAKPKPETKATSKPKPKKRKRVEATSLKELSKRDLMWAEVKFHPDTEWFSTALESIKPEDRERVFVVMSCGDHYSLVPGYSSGEVMVPSEANVILSVKYFE